MNILFAIVLMLGLPLMGWADERAPQEHVSPAKSACEPLGAALDSVQIETSDLKSFETFFRLVLRTPVIEQRDHPEKDSIRGYCYRGVRVVVRRDYATPRLTGWVQINFSVPDIRVVQREFETALKDPILASMSETERDKLVRLRVKSDVHRGNRKADRLEVAGPEGFMLGFNQYTEGAAH